MLLVFLLKNSQPWSRILVFYLFYSIFSDLILDQLSVKYFSTELYSFRVFTIIEYVSIAYITFIVSESTRIKKIITFFSIFFILSLVIDLSTNSIDNFDSLPTGVESILILFYCILILYEQITTGKPLFSFAVLFSFSMILFFSGTFFLFIMSQNNFENEEFSVLYDYIVAISKILMTLLISLGLLANRKIETKHHRTLQNI